MYESVRVAMGEKKTLSNKKNVVWQNSFKPLVWTAINPENFFLSMYHMIPIPSLKNLFFSVMTRSPTAGYWLSRMVGTLSTSLQFRHILHPKMSFGCVICAPLALENRQISFLGLFGRLARPTESSPHSPPDIVLAIPTMQGPWIGLTQLPWEICPGEGEYAVGMNGFHIGQLVGGGWLVD